MTGEPSDIPATAPGSGVAPGATGTGTVCYGFEASAPFELRTGRTGTGAPLEIAVGLHPYPSEPPLFEWTEAGVPFARLWTGAGHVLWLDDMGVFHVDPTAPLITVPPTDALVRREASTWSFPTLLCVIARGDLGIHAAAVEVDGRAVVLAAPGMHGKTTLASAFMQRGHRLLSEDLTCVDVREPRPVVHPGPSLLRVRRDSFERLGFPPSSVLLELERRVYVTEEDPGDGSPLPLAGIVFLRMADDGQIRLSPVESHRLLPELWTLSFKLPDDADRTRCFGQLASIASSVPAYDLHRPLSYDQLPEVMDVITDVMT